MVPGWCNCHAGTVHPNLPPSGDWTPRWESSTDGVDGTAFGARLEGDEEGVQERKCWGGAKIVESDGA